MTFEWIMENGHCTEADLSLVLQKKSGCILAYYTNEVCCTDDTKELPDFRRLLEIRIFDEIGELRAVRMTLGEDFVWRLADDNYFNENLNNSTFEKTIANRVVTEIQYLDIDSKRTEKEGGNGVFYTTGGGYFKLPQRFAQAERVEVQAYLNYAPETGMAMQEDWRIVRFLAKGEKSCR